MASVPKRPDLGRKLDDFERRLRQLERQTRLRSASIGEGGLSIYDGGGITIEGGGDFTIEGGDVVVAPPGSVHSSDYQAGQSGWSINGDGTAEFSDITLRDGAIGFLPEVGFITQYTSPSSNASDLTLNISKPAWANSALAMVVGTVSPILDGGATSARFQGWVTIDGTDSVTISEGTVSTDAPHNAIPVNASWSWTPQADFDITLHGGAAPVGALCTWRLDLNVLMIWYAS